MASLSALACLKSDKSELRRSKYAWKRTKSAEIQRRAYWSESIRNFGRSLDCACPIAFPGQSPLRAAGCSREDSKAGHRRADAKILDGVLVSHPLRSALRYGQTLCSGIVDFQQSIFAKGALCLSNSSLLRLSNQGYSLDTNLQ